MTKNEYLNQLKDALKKKNIADAEDILLEYEQHFAFKLADGFSEEEIAAKLAPAQTIAEQFGSITDAKNRRLGFLKAGLSFVVLFEIMFYILFFAWIAVIAGASVASAAIGVCLIGRLNIAGLIPYMPYGGALIWGVAFLALSLLLLVAAYYCFAYAEQIIKANARWRKNMLSANALPPLPWSPQFDHKARRALRIISLCSLTIFSLTCVLGYIVMALQAGALEFWHVWNWFVA